MEPTAAFVLGLLAGLGVGALVLFAALRATARITGVAPRTVPGLVLDGLRRGVRTDGVGAQRDLARRLKSTSERTAAGRRVAATTLTVHVSPEAHGVIDEAMGLEVAQADLAEFYRAHADRSGWIVGAAPQVTIVRDISLRPRQAFVRAETRADLASRGQEAPAATPSRPPVAERAAPNRPAGDAPAATPAVPPSSDRARPPLDPAAVTDVLPRSMLVEDATETRSYPIGLAEQAAAGDLLVVHGTDVRVVPVSRGLATVGRAAHNDIVVDAPGVARDHLLLEYRPRGWWVVPGPSAARASLDGRPVTAAVRVDGQGIIELGRGVRLRLTVEPER